MRSDQRRAEKGRRTQRGREEAEAERRKGGRREREMVVVREKDLVIAKFGWAFYTLPNMLSQQLYSFCYRSVGSETECTGLYRNILHYSTLFYTILLNF